MPQQQHSTAGGFRIHMWHVCRDLRTYWRSVVLVLTPLLLLPIPLVWGTKESRCGYVVLMMAIYWMAEVLPLPVTAFLPLVMYPVLGVMDAKAVSSNYLKDTNFLFVGGLIFALAVEESNLHKRLALQVLLRMGSEPRWILLGFMLITCFLSMWMSNTATTAMVVPIGVAVLDELFKYNRRVRQNEHNEVQLVVMTQDVSSRTDLSMTTPPDILDADARNEHNRTADDPASNQKSTASLFDGISNNELRMAKGLLLSICYAASIGGTGTLTGTGPNLVFSGHLDLISHGQSEITFASWMLVSVPGMIICLAISWCWLQLIFFDWRQTLFCCCKTSRGAEVALRKQHNYGVKALLRQKYIELGTMSFAEVAVAVLFVVLVGLWIFRQPKFVTGWSAGFLPEYVTDTTSVMLIACMLFVIPRELPDFLCLRKDRTQPPQVRLSLLTWDVMQRKFPWGIVVLLGGGFAMADGVQKSGLANLVSATLKSMHNIPYWGFGVLGVVSVTFLTEVSSNTATATIFVPLMEALATSIRVHPVYLMLPVTLASSFAFMLPVATPPNAIVFSYGVLRVLDMIIAGFGMNLICMTVTLLNLNTYAYWMLDLGTFPAWANTTERA